MSDFAIQHLPVGGGDLAITPMPGRAGDYPADLGLILAWAPDLVISMTAEAEFAKAGAAGFAADLAAAGIGWLHLPVVDFGVPEGLDWPAARDDAVAVLDRGGRVLVHCYGGCGRSGMMVLRLMISTGEAPDAALARLRGVRPCAVETTVQLAWAQDAGAEN